MMRQIFVKWTAAVMLALAIVLGASAGILVFETTTALADIRQETRN